MLPKHLVLGYITVELVFGWRAQGASATVLSGLIAFGMVPLLFSLVLAPLADAALGPRRWWAIGAVATCATLGALISIPFGSTTLTIAALMFVSQFGGNLILLAIDVVISATVAADRKGAANTWGMIGKYVGLALGGGGGLWLQRQGTTHAGAFAIVVAVVAVCSLALVRLGPDTRAIAHANVVTGLRRTLADVWSYMRTATGARLVVFCMLPIGLGTATDLWTIFAGHWHAGASVVGLIQGGPAEIATLAGIVVGGPLADRAQPTRAFFVWAMVNAALVVGLAFAPAVPMVLIAGALAYGFLFGLTQIVSLGVIYALIGERSGASKVTICNVLLNVPVMIVLAADGWIGDRFGMPAILIGEAVLTVVSLVAFLLLFPGSLARPTSARQWQLAGASTE